MNLSELPRAGAACCATPASVDSRPGPSPSSHRLGRAAAALTVLAGSGIGTAMVAPAAHADDAFNFARPGKYTITVPKDVTEATVKVWGAGGHGGHGGHGGAGGDGTMNGTGGGGAGGGGGATGNAGTYIECQLTGLQQGQTYEVVVGSAEASTLEGRTSLLRPPGMDTRPHYMSLAVAAGGGDGGDGGDGGTGGDGGLILPGSGSGGQAGAGGRPGTETGPAGCGYAGSKVASRQRDLNRGQPGKPGAAGNPGQPGTYTKAGTGGTGGDGGKGRSGYLGIGNGGDGGKGATGGDGGKRAVTGTEGNGPRPNSQSGMAGGNGRVTVTWHTAP
ncbi:hypothetical protein HHX38_15200 [Streptomyces sp. PKU-MA01144]|uniref:hypothetical protein n=1 Tax=Streptomyces sp. PKU-MA01144 TaxID=2729138 RepID=UPI00147B5143|nr:hypothetical protein [Streptomyces sp. PKU-MA01144]NNJ05475.1 hypothetical protein [Streptomyces sp. PKU-MA01144]